MSTATAVVFAAVVIGRFLIPLLIFRYPLPAIIACLVLDGIDMAIPQLTEERRRELVKQAKGKGEDAKVAIRNVRRKAADELKRIQKDGEAGEDEVSRAEKELDKTTATYVHQIDELVKHKEDELLEV